jgi:ABC-type spermidine/putrescine transport system permease subunit I
MAYAIARAPDKWRNILLMLVILPFWTSFLLRVYALSRLHARQWRDQPVPRRCSASSRW